MHVFSLYFPVLFSCEVMILSRKKGERGWVGGGGGEGGGGEKSGRQTD